MYKSYIVIIDGLKVGIIDLLPDDVKLLETDTNIKLMEV